MTGHFRQVFSCDADNEANRQELLRTLWREMPSAKPAEVYARLQKIGYSCTQAENLQARNEVSLETHTGENCNLDYSMDEIRAVRTAAEEVGGIIRLAALVNRLIEIRQEISQVSS
jgi:hypothetical protein